MVTQQEDSSTHQSSALTAAAPVAQWTAPENEQHRFSQARFPPEVPMDSSNPMESMATFMAVNARAPSSTPMQRSLSTNPSMASNTLSTEAPSTGSVAAATAAPDSISVYVSTSAVQPHSHSPRTGTNALAAAVSRDTDTDAIVRNQTPPSHPPFTAVTGNLNVNQGVSPHTRTDGRRPREGRGSFTTQVDDRIHFRLLNDTPLSTDPVPQSRQGPGRHDDDLGMDSPPLSTDRSNRSHPASHHSTALQYIDLQDRYLNDTDSASSEDELMRDSDGNFNLSHRQSSSSWRQHDFRDDRDTVMTNSNDMAAVAINRRPFSSNHRPELIEEEEEGTYFSDGDNNDDSDEFEFPQLGENGYHHYQSRHRRSLTDLYGLTPPSSNLEHPHHPQLSPRSAAALTHMFAMSHRPSWPRRHFIDSSITPQLEALSQQGSRVTRSEYDRNPHFRRPLPIPPLSYSRSPRLGSSAPHFGSRPRSIFIHRDSMETETTESSSSHGGTDGLSTATEPRLRSVSTQYDLNVNVGDRSSWTSHREGSSVSRTNCGDIQPTPGGTEMMGDVWPLKFDMYYADGGEFNAAHAVENVLKNDSSVYCSRRPANINICLKLAEPHQTFVLTRFSAKAPTNGFTAPCKEGLIFVSHSPIPLEKTALFDNMTREDYEKYVDSIHQGSKLSELLEQHGAGVDALIPAAFFQIKEDDKTCVLDFSPNRSGRYVLIKLLRSRCENGLQRPENIDLQYLGLIGKLMADYILGMIECSAMGIQNGMIV
ncbi:hypothetical protein EC968_009862 [Mortierella alpina]|nr:hypothetical protein EC968_009862 [Mortierella alpina]